MPTAGELPDINVLLALTISTHPFFDAASRWFDTTTGFATTPLTETGFVRQLLNPAIVKQTIKPREAFEAVLALRADNRHEFWPDDAVLAERPALTGALQGAKQVTDFHLLALVGSRDAVLVTFDAAMTAPLAANDRRRVRVLHT